jgi:hypothetical protein
MCLWSYIHFICVSLLIKLTEMSHICHGYFTIFSRCLVKYLTVNKEKCAHFACISLSNNCNSYNSTFIDHDLPSVSFKTKPWILHLNTLTHKMTKPMPVYWILAAITYCSSWCTAGNGQGYIFIYFSLAEHLHSKNFLCLTFLILLCLKLTLKWQSQKTGLN